MHREIQDQIEKFLAGKLSVKASRFVSEHVETCAECREEVSAMQRHSNWMHELRTPVGETPEPRPGFYARVMERIEAEGPISIWNIFIESAFGRRIGYASVALALVLGVYLVTSERGEEPMIASQGVSQSVAGQGAAGQSAVGQNNDNSAALRGDANDVFDDGC